MNNNQKSLSKEQIDSVMSLYAKGYFQEATRMDKTIYRDLISKNDSGPTII